MKNKLKATVTCKSLPMMWILLSRSLIHTNRKGKREIINNLTNNVSRFAQKIEDLLAAVEEQD